jgi:aminomethyltransferase
MNACISREDDVVEYVSKDRNDTFCKIQTSNCIACIVCEKGSRKMMSGPSSLLMKSSRTMSSIVRRALAQSPARATASTAAVTTVGAPRRGLATSEEGPPPISTALYDWHKEHGGDMVSFAGYSLPVLYKGDNGGVMKEHLWCRSEGKSALFDVSHMGQVRGFLSAVDVRTLAKQKLRKPSCFALLFRCMRKYTQIRWHGADRVKFLERIVVGDIAGLAVGSGLLSLVTNEKGGIIDDTVITNAGDFIYMVVNGATKHGDMAHFEAVLRSEFASADVTMEYLEDSMQLLAVQGPGAAAAVSKLLPSDFNLVNMAFMTGMDTTLDGVPGCRITRYVNHSIPWFV